MLIMPQLTAVVYCSQAPKKQTVKVCTQSEEIRQRGAAMRTANLRVNSQFLWAGFVISLVGCLVELFPSRFPRLQSESRDSLV